MTDRYRCAAIILVILGILFAISSALLFIFGNPVIESAVKKGCELHPGTPAYDNWRNPAVPLYLSLYVFDLNDTDFLNGATKPYLKQRGPFVYKEIRNKTNVRVYENETISYQEERAYTFDRTRSSEDETVLVTTVNVVYMAIVNFLQTEHVDPIFRRMVGDFLALDEQPTMQRTVKEILWGYHDPLLHTLKEVFPDIVADDEVSVFYAGVSDAGSDTFLINNGIDVGRDKSERIKNVGNIERFNYQTTLQYWSDEYANMINGTDSTLWHPETTKEDKIYIYSPDICRSLYLEYSETYTNAFGIQNYRFTVPDSVFAASEENKGFCLSSTTSNKTYDLKCLPSGLLSLKTCIHLSGSSVSIPLPIIASPPHFLGADLSVQSGVQGLTPDDGLHRSFMDVEPLTGTVMRGSRRMQININVVNDSEIIPIVNVKPVVFPMIWIDEHAEIDQPSANEFRQKVTTPMTILEAMKYVLMGVGIALFIVVIILMAYSHHRTKSLGPVFPPTAADETSPLLV